MKCCLSVVLILFIVLSQLMYVYLYSANRCIEGLMPNYITNFVDKESATYSVYEAQNKANDIRNNEIIAYNNAVTAQYNREMFNYVTYYLNDYYPNVVLKNYYDWQKNVYQPDYNEWKKCDKKVIKPRKGCGGRPRDPGQPVAIPGPRNPPLKQTTKYTFPDWVPPIRKGIEEIEEMINIGKQVPRANEYDQTKTAINDMINIITDESKTPFLKGIGISVGIKNAFPQFINENENIIYDYNYNSHESLVEDLSPENKLKSYGIMFTIVNIREHLTKLYDNPGDAGFLYDVNRELFEYTISEYIRQINTQLTALQEIYNKI
uniref:Uncharacterized protein n=1 Tax=viral metagenome TaxID=1070528 RepID=A0A6C0DW78_9ZZZZ